MSIDRVTKNDTYALLVSEGVRRGFIVVPEFRVEVSKDRRKVIDLVWLMRKPAASKYQNKHWSAHWHLVAAFEIEACDVSIKKEFQRHINNLPQLRTKSPARRSRFVVLYAAAFDRNSLNRKNIPEDIHRRRKVARGKNITVFSVGERGWQRLLPRRV